MTQPAILDPASLLSHETFVRSVVRGILRDDNDVQDAVQETWIAALRGSDQVESNARGWLRTTARRKALELKTNRQNRLHREASYAKPEVDMSRERLEAHSAVVQAVLGLEDPYRSAVLMRYFQGLEPKVIAERLGVEASTVRSQLTRAHEQLRGRLDRDHDRAHWAALALPTVGLKSAGGGAGVLASTSLSAGGWIAVGATAAAALVFAGWHLSQDSGSLEGSTSLPLAIEPLVHAEPDPSASGTILASVPALEPTSRNSLTPPMPTSLNEASEETQVATQIEGLQKTTTWLQRAIQERLLTPSPELVRQHAAFLEASPDHGIARVLSERESLRGVSHALPIRGNGCYYSFATKEHSYNSEPDISFSQRRFGAGFNGGQDAGLMSLGPMDLASIPVGKEMPPSGFSAAERASWSVLWTNASDMSKEERRDFDTRLRKEDRLLKPEYTGESFLTRMIESGGHDHIVAFQVLETDTYGCTILWRKLATWPMKAHERPYRDPKSPIEAASAGWQSGVAELSVEELLDQLRSTREELFPLILDVPAELRESYFQRTGVGADRFGFQGITRLLRRGSPSAILNVREGGAYFGFQSEERGYGSESDLELHGYGGFSTGFAGSDSGYLIDIGVLNDAQLKSALAGRNPFTAGHLAEVWDFVRAAEVKMDGNRKALTEASEGEAKALKLSRRSSSAPGHQDHTYLLRTAFYDDRDVTVLFTVLDQDETSAVIAWRVLQ